jgi:hypothetical protein
MKYFLAQFGASENFGAVVTSGSYAEKDKIIEIPLGIFLLLA